MYKRQQSPSWWLPSGSAIPNVTVEHGPGGLCPTQAVSGPHGAPRAASHRRPRERARRPRVAALQAAANGQRFARVPHVLAPNATAERRQRRLWPSPRAFSVACGGPHRTDWPPRGQRALSGSRAAAFPTAAAERLRAGASEAVCVRKYQQVAWLAYDGSRSS